MRRAGPRDAAARGIAFIHQELNLFQNLTVEENLFIGGFPKLVARSAVHRPPQGARARRSELLAAIELDVAPGTPVARLSQGERQLVEIAKALGADARIVIFDEPTTSLTARETERLFAQIGRLRATRHRDHLHQPHPGRRDAAVRPRHRAARRARGRQRGRGPR